VASLSPAYRALYEAELRERVIPFWEQFAPDRDAGGFFDCLDRDGTVYDTTKFMWMQWRKVWTFAHLYATLERRPGWLALAEDGFRFLTRHGRDAQGRYYFALTRTGVPLIAPYSVFSECFAAMGAAALFRANGDPAAREEARRAFANYVGREDRPKAEWTKELPTGPVRRGLGFYMIKANLLLCLEQDLGDPADPAALAATVETVLGDFWSPTHGVLFENVNADGTFDLDTMAGRHLNPGHALEAMWFVMALGRRCNRPDWIARAADIVLAELEFGWDREYGGLYYFMDVLGRPHVELQWNMKLWWVHNEAIVAAAMAHALTGRREFADWFERLHEWTWRRFPDPDYGEWFGYLDRRGDVTHTLKGGKWKCFFHLPRMLQTCMELWSGPDSTHGGVRRVHDIEVG
jgi:N-acylglucosamine 2-epimerase